MMRQEGNTVHPIDVEHLSLIRSKIISLHKEFANTYDHRDSIILDVAPEIYAGAKEFFKVSLVETLDICPTSGATYIADLANCNVIASSRYDLIFCTEVLEHTNDPFACAKSLFRMIKSEGTVVVTTPFNFRIHNPLPDNWRFTEHGLRLIFENAGFRFIEISQVDSERFLMPVQYITVLNR